MEKVRRDEYNSNYSEIELNPKNIKLLKEITKDSYTQDCSLVDNFTVFYSINKILYLIYSNKKKSIICYDLNKEQIINEIKNAHNKYISAFKYCLIENSNIDIIMSISYRDNNIKIWKVNNWECILNIKNINKSGYLFSGCFLKENENNQNYIITSNLNWNSNPEKIKVFDFNGKKIKEINDSNDITFFIDFFYDKLLNKNYILTANNNYVKSYDYNDNKLYKKYYDNNNGVHRCITLINYDILKLIESCKDGNIRIWSFHSGILLNKINCESSLKGICVWSNNYLFVGCENRKIKLLDLREGSIIENFEGHTTDVVVIKKLIHPKYGVCLISQGYNIDQIKLWNL